MSSENIEILLDLDLTDGIRTVKLDNFLLESGDNSYYKSQISSMTKEEFNEYNKIRPIGHIECDVIK